ncbi:MAG: RDD family protein [Terriglobales bacterium]
MLKPRFQPDDDPSTPSTPSRLIDPEAYDASEQQFAASLESPLASSGHHFIVEEDGTSGSLSGSRNLQSGGFTACSGELRREKEAPEPGATASPIQAGLLEQPAPDRWREEVAARVNHYRARRRQRAPRYPSLQLKFESPASLVEDSRGAEVSSALPVGSRLALATQKRPANPTSYPQPKNSSSEPPPRSELEGGGKILEFPRSWPPPSLILDELAEPVFVQPRILEVPAVLPPPPALGGILLAPADQPATERRPGFELPLQAAPLSRRILAGSIDAALVAAALALFACGFFRITATVPPWRLAATATLVLMAAFWTGYQYLLLVYAGTTPGLRLAKLELSRFDGTPVPQSLRRWRVLASALSGFSLALGYAWCFLDEDELCWHDRITRTYMAPKTSK